MGWEGNRAYSINNHWGNAEISPQQRNESFQQSQENYNQEFPSLHAHERKSLSKLYKSIKIPN